MSGNNSVTIENLFNHFIEEEMKRSRAEQDRG